MEAIYLLIPLAAVLVLIIIVGFLWAVRSGQFDDLEGPAYSILMDDDEMSPGGSESADKHRVVNNRADDSSQHSDPDGDIESVKTDNKSTHG